MDQVQEFLNSDPIHTFDEFVAKIKEYDDLSRNILYEFDRLTFTHIFEVHKGNLIEELSNVAKLCRDTLLRKILSEYQANSKM